MKLTKEIQQSVFNISLKEGILYKFLQISVYCDKTSSKETGFTDISTKEETYNGLWELIETVGDIIEQDIQISPRHHFDINNPLGMILLVREELIRELSNNISYHIGGENFVSSVNDMMAKELIEITVDKSKSFLKNVFKNISCKNNIMKFFSATIFISNYSKKEEIYDFSYNFIIDDLPAIIISNYCIHKYKETNDIIYLKLFENEKFDLEHPVSDEITESNIRDFIENLIISLRVANSTYIKNMSLSLIRQGRNQVKRK